MEQVLVNYKYTGVRTFPTERKGTKLLATAFLSSRSLFLSDEAVLAQYQAGCRAAAEKNFRLDLVAALRADERSKGQTAIGLTTNPDLYPAISLTDRQTLYDQLRADQA